MKCSRKNMVPIVAMIFLATRSLEAWPLQPTTVKRIDHNNETNPNGLRTNRFRWNIINGTDASPGEFPWQVALQDEQPFCGGTILNKQTILTAAHCVDGVNPSEITVVAGAHALYEQDGEQTVGVSSILVHESYDGSKDDFNNDIALLTLSTALTYTTRVKNIGIASSGTVPKGSCTAVGWGNIENGEGDNLPRVLQRVILQIVERQKCIEFFEDEDDSPPITQGMICANELYKGTCNGDSGSGFICKSSSGTSYLAGIVSWGQQPYCVENPEYPSIFTNIAHYESWIMSALGSL